MGNRRKSHRVQGHPALHGEVAVIESTSVSQLSRDGMLVETRSPLRIESLHDFRFALGGRTVVTKGRVVHCHVSDVEEDGVRYRVGVEFVVPSEHVVRAIDAFLGSWSQPMLPEPLDTPIRDLPSTD